MTRRELALAASGLVVLACAVYFPHVANGGWYYDDWIQIAQMHLQRDGGIDDVVEAAVDISHRPGFGLSLAALYAIGGTGQAPYLLASVLLVALEGTLLFVVLRQLRLRTAAAVAAGAILVTLPSIDATRLWNAAVPATLAVCLYLGGLALSLLAFQRESRRLHALGATLYVAAALTYESVIPLIFVTGALYLLTASRANALRRWMLDVAVAAGSLAYMAGRASEERGGDVTPGHLAERAAQLAREAVDVLGRTVPLDSILLGPLGVLAVGAALLGLARGVAAGGIERRTVARWTAIAAGGAACALAGLAMLLPASEYYGLRWEGVANRFGVVAALGEAVMLTCLVWLLALGLGLLVRRPRWVAPVATVMLGLFVLELGVQEIRNQRAWQRSWIESQRVVSAVRSALPDVPEGASIVTFRHPAIAGPGDQVVPPALAGARGTVPVFMSSWDLLGAMMLLYGDATVRAHAWIPGGTCLDEGWQPPPGPGDPPPFRYDTLFFVDAAARTASPVRSKRQCERRTLALTGT